MTAMTIKIRGVDSLDVNVGAEIPPNGTTSRQVGEGIIPSLFYIRTGQNILKILGGIYVGVTNIGKANRRVGFYFVGLIHSSKDITVRKRSMGTLLDFMPNIPEVNRLYRAD